MKKNLLVLILCIAPLFLVAQKPVAGDMGFTFGFNGLSTVNLSTNFGDMGTLLFRYYVQDDLAVRSRLDFTWSSFTTTAEDTSGFKQEDVTKDHLVTINLGLQKDFGKNLKVIEPYITGEIFLGLGKSGIMKSTTDIPDLDYRQVTETDPGNTFSFGLRSNIGFNIFPTDHFALGAEFGYGLQFSSTGAGEITTTTTVGNQTSTETSTTTPKSHSTALSGLGGQGLIMISVFFGK